VKPVDQTEFERGQGNCLSACLASILEIGVDEVPNFCRAEEVAGPGWLVRLDEWLSFRGWGFVHLDWAEVGVHCILSDCWVIAMGDVDGCEEGHAVVARAVIVRWRTETEGERTTHLCDYELRYVHDPHPRRTNLSQVRHVLVMVPKAV
jgi:hypothetical protein